MHKQSYVQFIIDDKWRGYTGLSRPLCHHCQPPPPDLSPLPLCHYPRLGCRSRNDTSSQQLPSHQPPQPTCQPCRSVTALTQAAAARLCRLNLSATASRRRTLVASVLCRGVQVAVAFFGYFWRPDRAFDSYFRLRPSALQFIAQCSGRCLCVDRYSTSGSRRCSHLCGQWGCRCHCRCRRPQRKPSLSARRCCHAASRL